MSPAVTLAPSNLLCPLFFPHQEEELRQSAEAKYQHLNEDLHVLIEVFAPPAEAYARMGHALEEIKKFLIPVGHTHTRLKMCVCSSELLYSPSIRYG